jgi:hypothetical protein
MSNKLIEGSFVRFNPERPMTEVINIAKVNWCPADLIVYLGDIPILERLKFLIDHKTEIQRAACAAGVEVIKNAVKRRNQMYGS